jgi:GNAT superfamily N-acetyltransferase
MEYEIRTHDALGDMTAQLTDLARLAFGSYDGVLEPSEAHRRWYARRPGMDGALSTAVVCGDQVVASVFVTVADMRLGGELRRTGLVDTVMTHPDHRRRGLARRALEAAIAGMRCRGLEASLLYTVVDSMPYRLYQALGYRAHARVRYLRRIQPEGHAKRLPSALQIGVQHDEQHDARLRGFLNDCFAAHDGYLPLDEALWRWRKVDRPPELPADVWAAEEGGRVLGCVTYCSAPVVGHTGAAWVMTDLAVANDARSGDSVLKALLAAVPPGTELLTVCPLVEEDTARLLFNAGFTVAGEDESGMVLPLTAAVEDALAAPPRRWHVAVESAIGV